MRAVFLENYNFDDSEIVLTDKSVHHLKNVLRAKEGDCLLLLNGQGLKVQTEIIKIGKKEISLVVQKKHIEPKLKLGPDVALGLVKREALELCFKMAVELGVETVHLFYTKYSQRQKINWERISKVLSSAYEQSNRAHKIFIQPPVELKTFDFNQFRNICLYESVHQSKNKTMKNEETDLVLIGPEGGFSQDEFHYLSALSNLRIQNLKTPILRSPTALTFALGQHYLF